MKLSIVIPNKNRLDIRSNSIQWLLKSLQWQVCSESIDILFADGGSDNYDELKSFIENYNGKFPMKVVQYKIDKWNKSLLNNFGIRNATGEYILRTDADIMFAKNFISSVIAELDEKAFVEARTMYITWRNIDRLYKGELDPYNNIDSCKIGRIKQRATCGGCQCTHIDNWNKLRGYNEEEINGWGSEDVELLERVKLAGIKIKWIGEGIEEVMLFHQPHQKNIIEDLKTQEKNKRVLENIRGFSVNPNGWGVSSG